MTGVDADLATPLLIEHCEQHSANLSMEPTPFQLEQAVNFLVATVPGWARRVEAELSRLRDQRDEYAERLAWHREERDAYMKGNVWVRRAAEEQERAEAAEARCARLQQALVAMVYVHPCNCGDGIPQGACARCRSVKELGFDPALAGPDTLTAGDQGERPDGTGRVAPADGCAERQSTADPSPAASAGPDTPADSHRGSCRVHYSEGVCTCVADSQEDKT